MGDENDKKEETKSTTFTFRPETEEKLLEWYPHALSLNEALRMAISDAQLVRESNIQLAEDDNGD